MQNKEEEFKFFNKLSADLQKDVVAWLPVSGVYHSLFASKQHAGLFKPMLDTRKPLYDFIHAVVQGEHDTARALLETNFDLLVARDQVTDNSGRTFENISGFEYALWALDKHMWTTLLECVPQNEEGSEIFAQLIAQYNKVSTEGVTYRLNGKTITEQHFDFENTIIKELQTQVDSTNAPGAKNEDDIDKQWREGVGGAQKLLPMHVVYEYCSAEPFFPVPAFTSQPKSSKQFYYWITGVDENWFSGDSKLAFDFAIYKEGAGRVRARAGAGCAAEWALVDLAAMTALCKVRTMDFINLASQLEEQMILDNHHQFVAK